MMSEYDRHRHARRRPQAGAATHRPHRDRLRLLARRAARSSSTRSTPHRRSRRRAANASSTTPPTPLGNRLQVHDYIQPHPEVLDAPVERPLIVLGMPRTGTTVISYLLDQDPARRSLLHWECVHPVPPATTETLRTDPRCLALLEEQQQHPGDGHSRRKCRCRTGKTPTAPPRTCSSTTRTSKGCPGTRSCRRRATPNGSSTKPT